MANKYKEPAYDYIGTYNESIELFQISNLTNHN